MQIVKVKRDDLLAKVRENREQHHSLYLKAEAGYREEAINRLKGMLKDAREGKEIRRSIELDEPENHTDDYDRVIAMLEMSSDETIELLAHEFDHYVRDNWAWKASAMMKASAYLK